MLEVQEAHIFDKEENLLRPCPIGIVAYTMKIEDEAVECAVCQLEEIGQGEWIYRLDCKHRFHR